MDYQSNYSSFASDISKRKKKVLTLKTKNKTYRIESTKKKTKKSREELKGCHKINTFTNSATIVLISITNN